MVPIDLYFPYLQEAQQWAKENYIDIIYDPKIKKWCCDEKYIHLFKLVESINGTRIAFQLGCGVYDGDYNY